MEDRYKSRYKYNCFINTKINTVLLFHFAFFSWCIKSVRNMGGRRVPLQRGWSNCHADGQRPKNLKYHFKQEAQPEANKNMPAWDRMCSFAVKTAGKEQRESEDREWGCAARPFITALLQSNKWEPRVTETIFLSPAHICVLVCTALTC